MMKAIFLDRDGTIIKDKNYLSDPKDVEWLPNALEGLLKLKKLGFELFLITNQSGIGRGYFSLLELQAVHEKIQWQMKKTHIGCFLEIEYCPHTPEDKCSCRKPQSLMIERILAKYDIDKKHSWMLGDKDIDVLCGKNAGIKHALVGQEFLSWAKENNILVFNDLLEFANSIN
jgi:D-glycero-D-manno-heptose 1,7-bisphosphate phosphatase